MHLAHRQVVAKVSPIVGPPDEATLVDEKIRRHQQRVARRQAGLTEPQPPHQAWQSPEHGVDHTQHGALDSIVSVHRHLRIGNQPEGARSPCDQTLYLGVAGATERHHVQAVGGERLVLIGKLVYPQVAEGTRGITEKTEHHPFAT
jgi:hypothetical protein